MSNWHVRLVTVPEITPHPNADTLGIVQIDAYPVVVKLGEFKPGDSAIYVPVDSIMPENSEYAQFLGPDRRVRAVRLRGVYSEGLLIPAPTWAHKVKDGHMHVALKITKYESPEERKLRSEGLQEPLPAGMVFPIYTDIEAYRKWPKILTVGERVLFTEKIHGANARFHHDGERLWVGSRKQVKRSDDNTWWWAAVKRLDLHAKFQHFPGFTFFGEVFGSGVQSFDYGTELNFRLFDIYTPTAGYVNYDRLESIANTLRLPLAPVLFEGAWRGLEQASPYAEGKSTIGGEHPREGIVIRPVKERFELGLGRVILKLVGEQYYAAVGK